nr:trace amine-associated receptor 13c-like [Paramormyrops kingsleyae]
MNISLELETYQYCYPAANGTCVKSSYSGFARFALYVFFASGMTVTIMGNLVVIISIVHFKQLHTPTNMLVMSLALADLLLGAVVMPFSMIRSVEGCWYFGDFFCSLHSTFDLFLSCVSVFHLISIAVDRYQAVCNPLRYHNTVTIAVAWLMVALSWAAAASYSCGLLYSKGSVTGLDGYTTSINCLGSCILLLNVLWKAERVFTVTQLGRPHQVSEKRGRVRGCKRVESSIVLSLDNILLSYTTFRESSIVLSLDNIRLSYTTLRESSIVLSLDNIRLSYTTLRESSIVLSLDNIRLSYTTLRESSIVLSLDNIRLSYTTFRESGSIPTTLLALRISLLSLLASATLSLLPQHATA